MERHVGFPYPFRGFRLAIGKCFPNVPLVERPLTEHLHRHGDADEDQWARQHAEKGRSREPQLAPATQALLREANVGPGCRILDVACGAGDTAAAATAAGAEATGIDTSRAMIQIARDRFPETRFEEGDMLTPPPGPWDAILCRLGAHHADLAWLAAAWAVLKPNGTLAIAERDATDPDSRAKGMKSLGEWLDLLESAGFVDTRARPTSADLDGRIYVISGRKSEEKKA